MSTNTEVWGNIELPGLDDDKLFKTNWNRVAAGLENKHNEKLLALAEQKSNDPEFSKIMKGVAEQRDEEYFKALRNGIAERDNSYQAECNSRPEVQAKISASMKSKQKTQEHLDKVAAKNKERSKPIQTPYGEFPSHRAAAEHMISIGIPNASRKLDKFLKTDPTNYFYF
jgi:hypothetical protein